MIKHNHSDVVVVEEEEEVKEETQTIPKANENQNHDNQNKQIMTSDPGIVCFQHCGKKVFCLKLPARCPACKVDLHESKFKLMPFRLPYPFVRASQYPCSVIIRPTTGDFLK